jgi:hypothetical protein
MLLIPSHLPALRAPVERWVNWMVHYLTSFMWEQDGLTNRPPENNLIA